LWNRCYRLLRVGVCYPKGGGRRRRRRNSAPDGIPLPLSFSLSLSLFFSLKDRTEPRHRFRIYTRIALFLHPPSLSRQERRRGGEREREREEKACESLKGPTGERCYRVTSFYCFVVDEGLILFLSSYFSAARSSTAPVYLSLYWSFLSHLETETPRLIFVSCFSFSWSFYLSILKLLS